MISQDRLKELLTYDPDSGLFYAAVTRGKFTAGNAVGSITKRGYVKITADYREYLAHRLAFLYMEGKFPAAEVDHINGVRSDNRWSNMRHATRSQNGQNRQRQSKSNTGIKGVTATRYGTYRAHVKVNNMAREKYFPTIAEAEQWAKQMRSELHGQFATDYAAAPEPTK